MESRVSACGLIVKSIQHSSKESGLSVISKEYLEAASKVVRDVLRSVLLGAAAGSEAWDGDHSARLL